MRAYELNEEYERRERITLSESVVQRSSLLRERPACADKTKGRTG